MTALLDGLRADLLAARRARDATAASALRGALSAAANAEAVDPGGPTVAAGLGADVARRALSEAEVAAVVAAERDDLHEQAALLRSRGAVAEAVELDARASVLTAHLRADEGAAPRSSDPA